MYKTCKLLIFLALKAVYPNQLWETNTTQRKPTGYWQDVGNQRKFFDRMALMLNITKPEDWYSVTIDRLLKNGGSFIRKYYKSSLVQGTLFNITSFLQIKALNAAYPEYKWMSYNRFSFRHDKHQSYVASKSQRLLFKMLQTLIPDVRVEENYRIPHRDDKGQLFRANEFDVSF
jgi:hypothetical protein